MDSDEILYVFLLTLFCSNTGPDKKHVGRIVPCAARQVNVGHGKVESSDGEGMPKTHGSWENNMILLLEEILHLLGCTKPCKYWGKLPISAG